MKYRLTSWHAIVGILLVFVAACTKIDTTDIGGSLIPEVDNINTFDTVLEVIANNYIVDDSTRLSAADAHPVGDIGNDAVFGSTRSTLFFELMPSTFPSTLFTDSSVLLPNAGLDSAILILSYIGHYGDSMAPASFRLYNTANQLHEDTLLRPNYNIKATSNQGTLAKGSLLLGSKTMRAIDFDDTLEIRRGTRDTVYERVVNQLRIRLDDNFARELFTEDTAVIKNYKDFRTFLKGFTLEVDAGAGALYYFSLSTSKLEFYYRQRNGLDKQDTLSKLYSFTALCGHAVNFERNRAGTEAQANTSFSNEGKDKIYIQATPGMAASITVPGMDALKGMNRVIHRAELRAVQDENLNQVGQLVPPVALYLDIRDRDNIYKGIPYDLSPYTRYYCYPGNEISFSYFGGFTKRERILPTGATDSVTRAVYRFNLTRFVQAVVTRNEDFKELRLSAPFYNFYQNCASGATQYPNQVFPLVSGGAIVNPIGRGRVKLVGSRAGVDPALRMQMRVIYSKL